MQHSKSILYLLAPALFLGASCTNIATDTNEVSNTNDNALPAQTGNVEVVTNTNETISNDNTNTADESGEVDLSTDSSSEVLTKEEASAEVDTSDPALSEVEGWLTYTNEEYGFSFKYPREWEIYTNDAGLPFLRIIDENADTSVSPKIFVDEDIIPPGTDTATALKLENGREASPLIQDEYLVVNNLKAYKAFRQIKKGEPSGYEGEPSEKTWTDIEYSYLSDNDLIRFWFTIQGEDYQKYIPIIDNIGQSVTK